MYLYTRLCSMLDTRNYVGYTAVWSDINLKTFLGTFYFNLQGKTVKLVFYYRVFECGDFVRYSLLCCDIVYSGINLLTFRGNGFPLSSWQKRWQGNRGGLAYRVSPSCVCISKDRVLRKVLTLTKYSKTPKHNGAYALINLATHSKSLF
jgi:hypothetical protein